MLSKHRVDQTGQIRVRSCWFNIFFSDNWLSRSNIGEVSIWLQGRD